MMGAVRVVPSRNGATSLGHPHIGGIHPHHRNDQEIPGYTREKGDGKRGGAKVGIFVHIGWS
jgi:hypothetical protein